MTTRDTRVQLVRLFTFIGGVYFFLYFVIPEAIFVKLKASYGIDLKGSHEGISNGYITVGAMALGLGLFNLISAHGSRIAFRKKGWIHSLALLSGLVAMVVVTLGSWLAGLGDAYRIRDIQILGDFATLLAKPSVEEQPQNGSVTGTAVKPFPERVTILVRSASERFAALRSELTDDGPAEAGSTDARAVLIREVHSDVDKASASLAKIEGVTTLDSQAAQGLEAAAFSLNKVAGSYAALLRFDGERILLQRGYRFLYDGLFTSLGSAMFALLGVYIGAAAYRAFRIRTLESALMMVAALIVMLGQISLGQALYEGMPALRQWLLEVPSSAAFRAIRLGAAVAGLMLAIRMWLSIESDSFSNGER